MNAVFLSDAHVRSHDDPNLPPLLAFLRTLEGRVDRLFLVGDLFDTWFAFPRAVFEDYVPLLGALDAVRRSGVAITYITGNHDFEPGRFLREILCAEIHDTAMTLEADGLRAHVAHGDMVNPHDRAYRRLRRILRNPATRWMGRHLPPAWIWGIGQWLSKTYEGDHTEARRRLAPLFQSYAEARFREGVSVVILGHLHVPVLSEIRIEGRPHVYANLGDWIRRRTFLRWEDGVLRLRHWAWPEGREADFVEDGEPSGAPVVNPLQ